MALVLNPASNLTNLAPSTAASPSLARLQTASPVTTPRSTADYFLQLSAGAKLRAAVQSGTATPDTLAALQRQYDNALGGSRNDGLLDVALQPQSTSDGFAALTRNSVLQHGQVLSNVVPAGVMALLSGQQG